MSRIDEIKARLEAATPGPWYTCERAVEALPGFYPILIAETARGLRGLPDAQLIAHAPDDIAYLLGEIDRLTADRDAWQKDFNALNEGGLKRIAELTADRDRGKRRAEAAIGDLHELSSAIGVECEYCKHQKDDGPSDSAVCRACRNTDGYEDNWEYGRGGAEGGSDGNK